jgi:hypothetical protein
MRACSMLKGTNTISQDASERERWETRCLVCRDRYLCVPPHVMSRQIAAQKKAVQKPLKNTWAIL